MTKPLVAMLAGLALTLPAHAVHVCYGSGKAEGTSFSAQFGVQLVSIYMSTNRELIRPGTYSGLGIIPASDGKRYRAYSYGADKSQFLIDEKFVKTGEGRLLISRAGTGIVKDLEFHCRPEQD